jgi:L-ascorbate metabolism protein UlaG (beta-lactamase superfamily)
MKVKYYGHASFKLTTEKGVRIILDPYESGAFGGGLTYGKITDEADLVLTSHDHADHNHVADIRGKFTRIDKEGAYDVAGVKIQAVPCFHDPSQGKERGKNLMFVVEADGLRLAHVGDLGHVLDAAAVKKLGPVDVLLLPVGGFYTIDAGEATRVMNDVKPKVTIPMHFKTEKCGFPIATVDDFTAGKARAQKLNTSEAEFTRDKLPKESEIIVLKHAL